MKFSRNKLITLVVLVAATVLCSMVWLYWLEPERRYRQMLGKYPAGTTAETIIRDSGGRLKMASTHVMLPAEASEEERRGIPAYRIDLPEADAVAFFNDREQLLRIDRKSDLLQPK